jgi:hypothetical protein
MRAAVLLAAGAALCVQPASAATVGFQNDFVFRDWAHYFQSSGIQCEIAYPCPYEVEWVFDSTWGAGFLRSYRYPSGSLHALTKLEVNGIDYLGNWQAAAYLRPVPLLPTGNVLKVSGHVPWANHGQWVTITRTAVPEPSTWAMMLLGFFGLGGMMRRRHRTPLTA